jgi:hypothetical protein
MDDGAAASGAAGAIERVERQHDCQRRGEHTMRRQSWSVWRGGDRPVISGGGVSRGGRSSVISDRDLAVVVALYVDESGFFLRDVLHVISGAWRFLSIVASGARLWSAIKSDGSSYNILLCESLD